MKKRSISALVILLLSVLLAAGSVSFLGPCVHEDGSVGVCHWAGNALCGIGVLLSVQSAAALICREGRTRLGLLLAVLMTAVLGFLIPGTMIGLCGMATMRCRALMQPAARILCGLIAVTALAGVLAENRKAGKST